MREDNGKRTIYHGEAKTMKLKVVQKKDKQLVESFNACNMVILNV